MVAVTREFADDLAEVARLLAEDEVADETLRRLTRLGTQLVPGAVAAAVTIATDHGALNFAASDPRVDELHDLQFDGGAGPVVESLGHNEPRRIDDMAGAVHDIARSAGTASADRRRFSPRPGSNPRRYPG